MWFNKARLGDYDLDQYSEESIEEQDDETM